MENNTITGNEPSSDIGYQWWLTVSNAPLVRQKLPLEAMLSYPVGAPGELKFFHFRIHDFIARRPFSIVRATLPSLAIIELTLASEKPIFQGLPQELGRVNIKEWSLELEKSFLNMQPAIMQLFPNQKAGALGKEYLELFNMLTPDVFKPFYNALNPEYFEWLQS